MPALAGAERSLFLYPVLRVEISLPPCGAHLDVLSWGLGDVSFF